MALRLFIRNKETILILNWPLLKTLIICLNFFIIGSGSGFSKNRRTGTNRKDKEWNSFMNLTSITEILKTFGARTFDCYEKHEIQMCKMRYDEKFAIIGKHPRAEDYHIIMFKHHFRYDNFNYFITELFRMCGIPEYMLHGII